MKSNRILAALAMALLLPAVQAAEMAWSAVSVVTKTDPASGQFARRGLAIFPGEVVPFTIEGQILSSEGPAQTFRTKIVYTFEDGSTLVQEGEGRTERQSPSRNAQSGSGRFTAGTGRWAGVSGTTTSTGKGFNTTGDGYTEFKADYTVPSK